MKLLTFTTLYPNAARPGHGVFVETRLRQLVSSGRVEAKVMAPVPWFPFRHARFGEYALQARAPRSETRHGLEILHPRYPVVPKVGMTLAPYLLSRGVMPAMRRLIGGFAFDVIDAHYFYPDGVAAAMLGKRFGKPVVITARGTDLNLIAEHRLPRAMIRWAAREAAAVITVSQALKERLVALGVAAEHIRVLRNGVDVEFFRPEDRAAARARLAMQRRTLLSVGNLLDFKGHDIAIDALARLPECELVVIGSGPERAALEARAHRVGVGARVRFTGSIPQEELRSYYGAADALVLMSGREGWPNVLLEAMACGTPVIANRVGGTPEIVASPEAGRLLEERSAAALAHAAGELFSRYPDRAATRRYAERFGWGPTTSGQLEIFERLANERQEAMPCAASSAS